MIGRLIILVIFVITFTIPVEARRNNKPPEPSEVYRTLDKLWKEKQFDVIQQYLDGLLTKWPGYVPAMVAETRRLKLDGAQYPEALVMIAKVEKALDRDPLSVSPGFYDLFKSYSRGANDAWAVYTKHGIGKKERQRRFKIGNTWRAKSSWKQELIFLSVPRAVITSDGFKVFSTSLENDDSFKELDENTLRIKTFDLHISDAERYAMAAELARRSLQDGMEGILAALSHPTSMLVAPYLVEGFWEIAKDMTDEELLKIFNSNTYVLEGMLLWVIAKAPLEQRFRVQNLIDKYAESFMDNDQKKYAEVLKKAVKRQIRANKYGKRNGGRPLPEEAKVLRGRSSKGKPGESKIGKTEANMLIIVGFLSVFAIVLICLWMGLKKR